MDPLREKLYVDCYLVETGRKVSIDILAPDLKISTKTKNTLQLLHKDYAFFCPFKIEIGSLYTITPCPYFVTNWTEYNDEPIKGEDLIEAFLMEDIRPWTSHRLTKSSLFRIRYANQETKQVAMPEDLSDQLEIALSSLSVETREAFRTLHEYNSAHSELARLGIFRNLTNHTSTTNVRTAVIQYLTDTEQLPVLRRDFLRLLAKDLSDQIGLPLDEESHTITDEVDSYMGYTMEQWASGTVDYSPWLAYSDTNIENTLNMEKLKIKDETIDTGTVTPTSPGRHPAETIDIDMKMSPTAMAGRLVRQTRVPRATFLTTQSPQ